MTLFIFSGIILSLLIEGGFFMKIVKDGYSWDMDKSKRENMAKLKELLKNLEKSGSELENAIILIRTYSSYSLFKRAFYLNDKFRNEFIDYFNQIVALDNLYQKYEDSGLMDHARNEIKYLIKDESDLDARYIINAYVNDNYSYDLEKFFKRYNIHKKLFDVCVNRVKLYDKDLYEKYLATVESNKTKRLVMPIYSINSILEGIETGKTIEGKKFDIFEFYKIAPFLDKDFDDEMRKISKDFPKLAKFKILKRDLAIASDHKQRITYADNLYLFTKCFNESQAETLRTWMDDNCVKNLTPIHRATTVNCYKEVNEEFNREDANTVFDMIEEIGYPKTREVFDLLKMEIINKKSDKKKIYEMK